MKSVDVCVRALFGANKMQVAPCWLREIKAELTFKVTADKCDTLAHTLWTQHFTHNSLITRLLLKATSIPVTLSGWATRGVGGLFPHIRDVVHLTLSFSF